MLSNRNKLINFFDASNFHDPFSDVLLLMQPLSILCRSFRDIDTYTTGFPCGDGQGHASVFRAVKHCLPGPVRFLFVLLL